MPGGILMKSCDNEDKSSDEDKNKSGKGKDSSKGGSGGGGGSTDDDSAICYERLKNPPTESEKQKSQTGKSDPKNCISVKICGKKESSEEEDKASKAPSKSESKSEVIAAAECERIKICDRLIASDTADADKANPCSPVICPPTKCEKNDANNAKKSSESKKESQPCDDSVPALCKNRVKNLDLTRSK